MRLPTNCMLELLCTPLLSSSVMWAHQADPSPPLHYSPPTQSRGDLFPHPQPPVWPLKWWWALPWLSLCGFPEHPAKCFVLQLLLHTSSWAHTFRPTLCTRHPLTPIKTHSGNACTKVNSLEITWFNISTTTKIISESQLAKKKKKKHREGSVWFLFEVAFRAHTQVSFHL